MSSHRKLKIQYRIAIRIFMALIFIFMAVIFIKKSFSVTEAKNIKYNEKSNIDYKVFLKNNDFYEKNYLDKDMAYVASLIDNIQIDYTYLFNIDTKSYIDFNYSVVAKLSISDSGNENVYYEKEYVIDELKTDRINNANTYDLNKKVKIDYGYYNDLANKFRNNYGVSTNSNLTVYLKINKQDGKNNKFDLAEDSNMSLTIPLSERSIKIKMNYKEINTTDKLVGKRQISTTGYGYLIGSVLLIILTAIQLIRVIKLIIVLQGRKSKFDKHMDKILKEYDRLIVETPTNPKLLGNNVIEVDDFNELLDVRDNLKLPIKHYVVEEHTKSIFYINTETEMYVHIIEDVDFDD